MIIYKDFKNIKTKQFYCQEKFFGGFLKINNNNNIAEGIDTFNEIDFISETPKFLVTIKKIEERNYYESSLIKLNKNLIAYVEKKNSIYVWNFNEGKCLY